MAINFAGLMAAARLSIEQPRAGARQILNLQLSASEAWTALALMAVGSTLMAEVGNMVAPYNAEPMVAAVFDSPFALAALQFTVMAGAAVLTFVLGRWAGGVGRFVAGLVLVAWLQSILLLLQLVQLIVILAIPQFAAPIGLFGLVLFGWLLTNFIAELHGFTSLGKVFLGILAGLIGFSVVLAVVLIVVFGVRT